MKKRRILGVVMLIGFSLLSPVKAEDTNSAAAAEDMPRLVPYVDYSGDLWTRPVLTGDWGGTRQELMEKGLRFDINLTQTFQHNWAGGTKYESTYQGGLDFGLQLDTGKMDLWPGGLLKIRGETRFGQANNLNTGSLLPVNTDSLFPVPGEDITTLTDLYYIQFLSPQIAAMGGKMSLRDTNIFASNETEQFLNTAFNFNPVIGTTFPLCFLAAGVIVLPTDWLNVTTLVLDSEGHANHCGFPEAFQRGTSVYQVAEVTVKPGGLTGHQRVGWTWSDKSSLQFSQDSRVLLKAIITGDTSELTRKSSDWSFFYDFDQYLYTVPGTKDRGFGLFGRFGVSDGEANPTETFYSLGMGGKGMIPGRENDTFGIGYYFLNITDKLPRLMQSRVDDEQGVEMYYNIAVTPWLHITPDIQIINPVIDRVDTTVVAGVRMKIDF